MIGDYLYELSLRDQQVTWLDPLAFRSSLGDTQALIDRTYVVPDGRALILSTAVCNANAGATQTVTVMSMELFAPGDLGSGAAFDEISGVQLGVLSAILSLVWSGRMYIPAGWLIRARVVYSAATNINTNELNLTGLLIPIGNIQRT